MQIEKKIRFTESALDIADLTTTYGLQSFKYEKSNFIEEVADWIQPGPGDVLFDLGSGYGEPLFYLAEKFGQATFVGIEIVKERFDIAAQLLQSSKLNNIEFTHSDILKTDLSRGNLFYIFNPLFGFQYPLLSRRLRKIAITKKISIIVEAKACDHFDKLRWLTEVKCIHVDCFSRMKIYESK